VTIAARTEVPTSADLLRGGHVPCQHSPLEINIRLSYCVRANVVNPFVEEMAVDETDLIYSKHCQMVSRDGNTVRVEIYSSGKNDWILEVVDEQSNSTVWDDPFPNLE
jgi:hypothetical protein